MNEFSNHFHLVLDSWLHRLGHCCLSSFINLILFSFRLHSPNQYLNCHPHLHIYHHLSLSLSHHHPHLPSFLLLFSHYSHHSLYWKEQTIWDFCLPIYFRMFLLSVTLLNLLLLYFCLLNHLFVKQSFYLLFQTNLDLQIHRQSIEHHYLLSIKFLRFKWIIKVNFNFWVILHLIITVLNSIKIQFRNGFHSIISLAVKFLISLSNRYWMIGLY